MMGLETYRDGLVRISASLASNAPRSGKKAWSGKILHLTLIHQSVLKPFRKEVKEYWICPLLRCIILDDEVLGKKIPRQKVLGCKSNKSRRD